MRSIFYRPSATGRLLAYAFSLLRSTTLGRYPALFTSGPNADVGQRTRDKSNGYPPAGAIEKDVTVLVVAVTKVAKGQKSLSVLARFAALRTGDAYRWRQRTSWVAWVRLHKVIWRRCVHTIAYTNMYKKEYIENRRNDLFWSWTMYGLLKWVLEKIIILCTCKTTNLDKR